MILLVVSLMYQLTSPPWHWVDADCSTRTDPHSKGELVPSSSENAEPATVRRRMVGKRTISPPVPLAKPDNVDSEVPDSVPEAGMPEAPEPSDGDTKKRRVEPCDESVDWFSQRKVIHSMTDKLSR